MHPDPAQQNTPLTVLFTPDGHPYYAPVPGPAAPLMPYQPAPAPLPVYQPAYLPTAPQPEQQYRQPGGYSPARDPWVARLLAGGVGIGAAGVGVGFLLQALAAATTALAALAAVLALIWLLAHSGGSRGAVNVRVTNRNR